MSLGIICSFTSPIADLPRGKRTEADMLAALDRNPRVSTFDMSEFPWLWRGIDSLKARGLITEDKGEAYPWHRYTLTDAGKAALAGTTGGAHHG